MTAMPHRDAQTVVQIADHMGELRRRAIGFQSRHGLAGPPSVDGVAGDGLPDAGHSDVRGRGYFTPDEDDQVTHLWVSYHMGRASLLDLIHSIRNETGRPCEESAGQFAVAYAAALVLVDAARSLRDRFAKDDLVRRKLNEAFGPFGIPGGTFDAIQLSLTDPITATRIRQADRFFAKHRERFESIAQADPIMAEVIGRIDKLGERVHVGTRQYLRARVRQLGRDTRDRLVKENMIGAVYAIQQWTSRLVSNVSTRPGHIARIPESIAQQLQTLWQPGDVFVTRKEAALTNYFLPGYWPHAAMYVGDDHVVESLKDGVRRRPIDSALGNDAIAVIRPNVSAAVVAQAIARAHTHVGKPYDFDFDFTRADRMVCTEVVYRSYEGLGGIRFELKRRAGRQTISAEDLLSMAIAGDLFTPVAAYCPNENRWPGRPSSPNPAPVFATGPATLALLRRTMAT